MTLLLCHLVIAEPVLARAVVVGVALKTALDTGFNEGVDHLMALTHVGDIEGPACSPQFVAATFEVFNPTKKWHYIRVRPTPVTELCPLVVVERLSAYKKHAVD